MYIWIFQRENFGEDSAAYSRYVFRREPVSLFWGRKASESLFAITLAQESFPPSRDGTVAFLDSLFRKAFVSKWTIAIVIVRETSRSASAFAPRFLQLSSSRNSSRFFANSNPPASLSSRSMHPTTYRLALSQQSVFPRSKKVSSTRQENIFETVKSPSRASDAETTTKFAVYN